MTVQKILFRPMSAISLFEEIENPFLPPNRNHRSSRAKTTSHGILLKVSGDYTLFTRPS